MENIPYFDFSSFPLNSENILNQIELSAGKEFNSIFINFGEFFPWSEDTVSNSKFAYSDKLIDKIDNICSANNVNLIPVISVLINCDFILKNKKYKYLLNEGLLHNGLDISSCGAVKLLEQLIDDIFSLTLSSNYLLLEFPVITNKESKGNIVELINPLINRLTEHLLTMNKSLIIGWNKNKQTNELKYYFKKNKVILMNYFKTYPVRKGKYYNIDINDFSVKIKGIEYTVSKFSGTDCFIGNLNIGNFILSEFNKDEYTKILDILDSFYLILNSIWDYIRISWENLSFFYNNIETVPRLKFIRSVHLLKQKYVNFEDERISAFNIFENYFQPDFFKNWMDGKSNSIINQINILESIARQMSDGQ